MPGKTIDELTAALGTTVTKELEVIENPEESKQVATQLATVMTRALRPGYAGNAMTTAGEQATAAGQKIAAIGAKSRDDLPEKKQDLPENLSMIPGEKRPITGLPSDYNTVQRSVA